MQFNGFYRKTGPVISFEVFPPKTDPGIEKLKSRLCKLKDLGPSFITVTYGAFGNDRNRTLEIARSIRHELSHDVAHHLTCVGSTRQDIDRTLDQIADAGIENIVALRGDPPQGQSSFVPPTGGFRYACELVEHIHKRGRFGIAVAGYPEKHTEAPDFKTDLQHLKTKVEAGADLVLTQLFYDNRHYYRFLENCRALGIDQPIIPGLLPILNVQQVRRITRVCGASLPRHLLAQLELADGDEARVHEIGINHTLEQAKDLLENGVPGIHFYVLNRYFHIAEVMRKLSPAVEACRRKSQSARDLLP